MALLFTAPCAWRRTEHDPCHGIHMDAIHGKLKTRSASMMCPSCSDWVINMGPRPERPARHHRTSRFISESLGTCVHFESVYCHLLNSDLWDWWHPSILPLLLLALSDAVSGVDALFCCCQSHQWHWALKAFLFLFFSFPNDWINCVSFIFC